jgi:hypothetical protein
LEKVESHVVTQNWLAHGTRGPLSAWPILPPPRETKMVVTCQHPGHYTMSQTPTAGTLANVCGHGWAWPLDYKSHIECTSPSRSKVLYICALPIRK